MSSFLAIWIAPLSLAGAIDVALGPGWLVSAAWAGAFAWTGGACLFNARRCARLHCFISRPILLLGAVASGALAFGAINADVQTTLVAVTLVLAALSYGLELIWGRYARSNGGQGGQLPIE